MPGRVFTLPLPEVECLVDELFSFVAQARGLGDVGARDVVLCCLRIAAASDGIATTAARARTPDATVSQNRLPTESEKALSIRRRCADDRRSCGSVAASCFERFTPAGAPRGPEILKLLPNHRSGHALRLRAASA